MLEVEQMDARRRRRLLSDLDKVATERSVGVLRAHLSCKDMKSRVGAVLTLSKIDTNDAAEALIEALSKESGAPLTFIIKALGNRHAEGSAVALIRTLEERHDELHDGDKIVIMHALLKMPHKSAVPVLAATLRKSRRRKTRRAAAMALAQIRAPESRTALEEAAKSMSWFKGAPVRRALRWRTTAYGE